MRAKGDSSSSFVLPYLSVERLFAGQLVLQLVFDVVERRRLPLGAQVPAGSRTGVREDHGEIEIQKDVLHLRSRVVILSSMSSL